MTLKDAIETRLRRYGLMKNQPVKILDIMRNDTQHDYSEYLGKELKDCPENIINSYFRDACRYAVWYIDLVYPCHSARPMMQQLYKIPEICW